MQDLANGHLDVKALGEAANGDENTIVTTRTGNTYPSAERAINIMFKNGGLPAEPFATKALMTASALVDGKYAQVTDDAVNNGLYVKTAGAWVKSKYSMQNLIDNAFEDKLGLYVTTNMMKLSTENTAKGYFGGAGVAGTTSTTYRYCTDYFPAKVGDVFWFTNNVNGYQVYDSAKNPIWGGAGMPFPSSVEGNPFLYKVPEKYSQVSYKNVAYIRFSFVGGDEAINNNTVAVGRGGVVPDRFVEPDEIYAKITNAGFLEAIKAVSGSNNTDAGAPFHYFENLIDPSIEAERGFWAATTISGTGTGYEPFWLWREYYKASVGTKLWFKNIASVQFYDTDKNPIASIYAANLTPYVEDGVFEIPATYNAYDLSKVAYIRVSTSAGLDGLRDGLVGMGYGDIAPKTNPTFGVTYYEPKDGAVEGISNALGVQPSPLSGKKVVLLGDSISNHSSTFLKQICDRYGATLTKHTRDGARIHRTTPDDINLILSEVYTSIIGQPDLIIVAGGTNDNIATLGSFADRDTSTLYGALHVMMAGMRGMFPHARIGFLSPIPSSARYVHNSGENTPYLKYKAIEEVGAYYSIPVWNGNLNFGASPNDSVEWKAQYMPDTLHPSTEGHTWYANRVESFILNLAK